MMTEQLILAFFQMMPQVFAAFQQMQANGQIKDQATLDAGLAAQQAAAQADFSKLVTDLGGP